VDPADPEDYELIFGPTSSANKAPSVSLSRRSSIFCHIDTSYFSTWASPSSIDMTLAPALNNATPVGLMVKVELANTSTSGAQL